MIVFDLKCTVGHVFEGWFNSSAGFEEQRSAGLIACPTCGSHDIEKAVMAPNVAAKGNRRSDPVTMARAAESPAEPAAMMARAVAMLAEAQARMLKESQWVGTAFAGRARSMHDGDEPAMPIHGQASREEAEALIEDGVPVMPLLVPVTPPEQLN